MSLTSNHLLSPRIVMWLVDHLNICEALFLHMTPYISDDLLSIIGGSADFRYRVAEKFMLIYKPTLR
jgi:hypothetical protein